MALPRLALLTADLPGIGGELKCRPEDFQVEEIPAYPPSGHGSHTYALIQKTGLSTESAIARIAAALDVPRRKIGYAGLKDARAVTRQTVSIEHVDPAKVADLNLAGIEVLEVSTHTNKLKLGHLKGNRFVVKIRELDVESPDRARAVLDVLIDKGMPNYFGPQRFGLRGDNAAIGMAAGRGDYGLALEIMLGRPDEADSPPIRQARTLFDAGQFVEAGKAWPSQYRERRQACFALDRCKAEPDRAWRSLAWPARRIFLSAMQSALFNRVTETRLRDLGRLLHGDLAVKHVNGAVFQVTDADTEQPRADRFEISPTGPLIGKKMSQPVGQPGAIEAKVFAEAGLTPQDLTEVGAERLDGARRPLRVQPQDVGVSGGSDAHGSFIELRFSLPPGSYATSLAREVCKSAAT
ncbi:MAG: tRNA pseudouridine(13) synthase TruD [Phycisphaerae bacterium]